MELTTTNQQSVQPAPLFGLPAEIRLCIYHFLLCISFDLSFIDPRDFIQWELFRESQDVPVIGGPAKYHCLCKTRMPPVTTLTTSCNAERLGFIRACRKMHSETTALIYYERSVFMFDHVHGHKGGLIRSPDPLGSSIHRSLPFCQWDLIRHIQFHDMDSKSCFGWDTGWDWWDSTTYTPRLLHILELIDYGAHLQSFRLAIGPPPEFDLSLLHQLRLDNLLPPDKWHPDAGICDSTPLQALPRWESNIHVCGVALCADKGEEETKLKLQNLEGVFHEKKVAVTWDFGCGDDVARARAAQLRREKEEEDEGYEEQDEE